MKPDWWLGTPEDYQQAKADHATGRMWFDLYDTDHDVPDVTPDDYPLSEREETYRAGMHYPTRKP